MMRYKILFISLLVAVTQNVFPQTEDREITNVQTIGLGASNILDTYLSQEKYNGMQLRYISHTTRQPYELWSEIFIHQGIFSYAEPRSENNSEQMGMYIFDYGRYRDLRHDGNVRLRAGFLAEIGGGFLYNNSNTNNPAQGRLYLNVSPAVTGEWTFKLFNKWFTACYELSAPLIGAMFSPNYGQSYYEIFSEGNYDHNVVFTTPFNAPSLRHSLALDIPMSKVSLRIGYLGDYQQAKVNNLKYHTYSHLLTIGVVKTFIIHPLTR